MKKVAAVVVIGLMFAALLACSLSRKVTPASLPVRLRTQLNRAIEAEARASDLWDRILFGEVVSCIEILDSPFLFELTPAEIENEPLSVPVHDHLNAALLAIHKATVLWDQECESDSATISLAVVRQAKSLLQTARNELQQATEAWQVWRA